MFLVALLKAWNIVASRLRSRVHIIRFYPATGSAAQLAVTNIVLVTRLLEYIRFSTKPMARVDAPFPSRSNREVKVIVDIIQTLGTWTRTI